MFKLQIESKKLINLLNFNLSDQIKVNEIAKKIKEFSKKKNLNF